MTLIALMWTHGDHKVEQINLLNATTGRFSIRLDTEGPSSVREVK